MCALAADVATVSYAHRGNKAGVEQQSSAVTQSMDKLGSLLQTRGYSMLSHLRITPKAKESMNDALSKVISEIEDSVLTKIKAAHEETQAAINQTVEKVKAATTTAVAQKGVADVSDDNWFKCVRDEKALRAAIEEAEAALQSSRRLVFAPCHLQEVRKNFSSEPDPAGLQFACDISKNGNCDSQFKNYETRVSSMVRGVKSDATKASELWTAAKATCDKAKAEVVKKQSAENAAKVAWTDKRDKCLVNHEARLVSMCLFGWDLQFKCEQVEAYSSLVKDAKEEGGEHSNLDRVKEWKAAVVTKCMLQKIIDGGEIDSKTLEGCEGSVDFDSDVGVLDQQGTVFAEQTSSDKFTCSESKIKFSGGLTWVVPDGTTDSDYSASSDSDYSASSDSDYAASSDSDSDYADLTYHALSEDYVEQTYEPAVDLKGGSAPFDFCNAK